MIDFPVSSLILLSNADIPRVLRLLYNTNKGNLNTLQEDNLKDNVFVT